MIFTRKTTCIKSISKIYFRYIPTKYYYPSINFDSSFTSLSHRSLSFIMHAVRHNYIFATHTHLLTCNHIYFISQKKKNEKENRIFFSPLFRLNCRNTWVSFFSGCLAQPPACCSIKPFFVCVCVEPSSKACIVFFIDCCIEIYTNMFEPDLKMIWLWQQIRRKTFNDHINFMAKQANLLCEFDAAWNRKLYWKQIGLDFSSHSIFLLLLFLCFCFQFLANKLEKDLTSLPLGINKPTNKSNN